MNFKSFLMIALSILAAFYTVMDGGYKYINYSYTKTAAIEPPSVILNSLAQSILESTEPQKSTEIKPDEETKPDEEAEKTTLVSATGTAKGKIISEFLSPYTANTKHGKVYIKNSTGKSIDIAGLLSSKLSFNIKKSTEPQVLIMHTHTTESYILHDSDYYTENDASRRLTEENNMVAIGNIFEEKLRAAGIGVIHDTTIHDHPSYSGSYTRAAETISSDLAAYPTVKIVIDIHRDAITRDADKVKPVVKIDGKNAAQVMLVMGSQTGGISGFPNWQENLKLAIKYQEKMEEKYPGLARSIMLNSAKYNQNLTKGSLLLEVGSEANTLSEAKYGASLAADALIELLGTLN